MTARVVGCNDIDWLHLTVQTYSYTIVWVLVGVCMPDYSSRSTSSVIDDRTLVYKLMICLIKSRTIDYYSFSTYIGKNISFIGGEPKEVTNA